MILARLREDTRSGLRFLRTDAVQSALIVTVLSVGIGANLAIFGAVDLALLRPLRYPDGDRLVVVQMLDRHSAQVGEFTSYPIFDEWKRRSSSFAGLTAYVMSDATLTGPSHPELLQTAQVLSDFFPMLGVRPSLGRWLNAEDDRTGSDVVVLSHRCWVSQFGGTRDVLSKTLVLDGQRYTIVGVMPPLFEYPTKAVDLWRPLVVGPGMKEAGLAFWAGVVGRLRPLVSPATAQAEASSILTDFAQGFPEAKRYGAIVRSVRLNNVGDARQILLFLQAAVACLLLIACANAASILVLRGERRQQELATRAALGATRGQLVRQLLTEGTVLAVLSGVVGLVVGKAATSALFAIAPPHLRALGSPPLDTRLLFADVVLSVGTVVFFALLPALRVSKPDLLLEMRGGFRGLMARRGSRRTRGVLVGCECALAVVLLVAAGLFGRALWNLRHVDPGFSRDGVLTAAVRISPISQPTRGHLLQASDRLVEGLSGIPGVTAAGVTLLVLSNEYQSAQKITLEADRAARAEEQVEATVDPASPDYFRVMQVPLLQGRTFEVSDGPDTARVALVNEAMARRAWPGENPIGRRLVVGKVGAVARWVTVVGVVGDMRRAGLERGAGNQLFLPLRQMPSRGMTIAIRTALPPEHVVPAMRQAVWNADKEAAIWDVKSVAEMLDESVTGRRFQSVVLAAFAAVAFGLATIGVFALAHRAVTTRNQELGLRMALGATRPSVLRLVVWDGLRPAIVGVGCGLAASLAVGSTFSGLLYGVVPWDLLTLGSVGCALALAALLASLSAGWRATRTDPSVALRCP